MSLLLLLEVSWQKTYPGGAAGMLTGSPQRECCGQEHAGRECPHKRSGGCWERCEPAQEHSHASDLQEGERRMTWYKAISKWHVSYISIIIVSFCFFTVKSCKYIENQVTKLPVCDAICVKLENIHTHTHTKQPPSWRWYSFHGNQWIHLV